MTFHQQAPFLRLRERAGTNNVVTGGPPLPALHGRARKEWTIPCDMIGQAVASYLHASDLTALQPPYHRRVLGGMTRATERDLGLLLFASGRCDTSRTPLQHARRPPCTARATSPHSFSDGQPPGYLVRQATARSDSEGHLLEDGTVVHCSPGSKAVGAGGAGLSADTSLCPREPGRAAEVTSAERSPAVGARSASTGLGLRARGPARWPP